MSGLPPFPHFTTTSTHSPHATPRHQLHHQDASTSTSPTPTPRRSSRKNRHQVNVPADSVLTFSSYHPPQPSSSPTPNSSYHHYYHHNHKGGASNSNSNSSKLQPRPREQFVQANYRFLTTPSPDLPACKLFPDAQVPWSSVDVVVLPRPSDSCPICLYPLRAPRVTPCGHVFDHVCMLQLFSHHEHPRCPLCAHHVTASSLRPCSFATALPPIVDATFTMRLVSRKRGSMICHPHPQPQYQSKVDDEYRKEEVVPVVSKMDSSLFCRFAFSTPAFLLQLIDCDNNDLKSVLRDDVSLTPFVNAAFEELEAQRQNIRMRPVPMLTESVEDSQNLKTDRADSKLQKEKEGQQSLGGNNIVISKLESFKFDQGTSATSIPIVGSSTSSQRNVAKPSETKSTDTNSISTPGQGSPSSTAAKSLWYFYQDKQSGYTFLHPVNHRCLTTEFNNDFSFGATREIMGRIVQVDRYIMDETLRKRYRFLEHLPDGCEFAFIELDLKHMLSKETLKVHEGELRDRRAARRRREIEQEKESKRAEKAQSEQLRDYYSSLGNETIPLRQMVPVDGTDAASFPKLKEDDDSDDVEAEEETMNEGDGEGDGEGEGEDETLSIVDGGLGVGRWGREVSSYSSVTSNMGLFPALGISPQDSRQPQGVWGGASSFPPRTEQGNSPSNADQREYSRSDSRGGASSNSNASGAGQKVEARRNGRRSNGKSTILFSTAGSQARR